MRIPVIDLEPVWTGDADARRMVAKSIARACEDIGFFILAGHRVPPGTVKAAFASAADFFDLPVAEKNRFRPDNPAAPRGYHAIGTRNLARTIGQVAPSDLREQFFIGPLDPSARQSTGIEGAAFFHAANIWPDEPPAYRAAFEAYYRALEALGAELMRLCALALDLPEHYFDDKTERHFNTCPANHYPPLPTDPLPGQIRAGAHTDYGSLTILAFDGTPGGLEVRLSDGEWREVVPGAGEFAVNIGDLMQRWTNDRWRSTLHRVVNPRDPERAARRRQTISYFMNPNFDAEIRCLETCQDADNPPRHPPILTGDHYREKMRRRVEI